VDDERGDLDLRQAFAPAGCAAEPTGLTANDYKTLMALSDAPKRELSMAELANVTGLSASRVTRLVDDLQSRGFVIQRACAAHGPGNVAKLAPQGFAKLKSAWPAHLASAVACSTTSTPPRSSEQRRPCRAWRLSWGKGPPAYRSGRARATLSHSRTHATEKASLFFAQEASDTNGRCSS
jgi:DNA-binding MarR family transcriptional regulator